MLVYTSQTNFDFDNDSTQYLRLITILLIWVTPPQNTTTRETRILVTKVPHAISTLSRVKHIRKNSTIHRFGILNRTCDHTIIKCKYSFSFTFLYQDTLRYRRYRKKNKEWKKRNDWESSWEDTRCDTSRLSLKSFLCVKNSQRCTM